MYLLLVGWSYGAKDEWERKTIEFSQFNPEGSGTKFWNNVFDTHYCVFVISNVFSASMHVQKGQICNTHMIYI